MATRPTVKAISKTNTKRPVISSITTPNKFGPRLLPDTQPILQTKKSLQKGTNISGLTNAEKLAYYKANTNKANLPVEGKSTVLGTIANTGVQVGKGITDFGESVADTALQFGSSKLNPYYWFNKDKLERDQRTARELIEKDQAEEFTDKLGYNKQLANGLTIQEQLDASSALKSTGLGGQTARTIGSMLPNTLIGGAGATTAAKIAGSTVPLAAKAFGGSIEEAYKSGATRGQANLYGAANTAVELATEYITGGVPGVKTGFLSGLDKLAEKGISKVTNGIVKALLGAGYKAVGEGFEEALAEIINPYLKNATFSQGNKVNWENVLNSAVQGAIAGGILNAPGDISNIKSGVQETISNKKTTTKKVTRPTVKTQVESIAKAKEDVVLYRGGKDIGSSFSTSEDIAKDYAKNRSGEVKKYTLDKNSKIIDYKNIPGVKYQNINDYNVQDFTNGKTVLDFMEQDLENDYTKAEKWAKDNGYDVIQFPTEAEMRVLSQNKIQETQAETNAQPNIIKGKQIDEIAETQTGEDVLEIKSTKPLTEKQLIKQKEVKKETRVVEKLKKDITKSYSKVIPNKFSKQYIKTIRKNPDLVKDTVAVKPNGKLAIRDSGVFTPKVFNTAKFKDIKGFAGQQSYNFLAAAGEFDNITKQQANKNGEWGPMKQFSYSVDQTLAEKQTFIVDSISKLEGIAKKYNINVNNKTGNMLFNGLEGKFDNANEQKFVYEVRKELNKLRLGANIQRRALGKPDIGFIKNYAPHIQKVSFFNKKVIDKSTTLSDNFDFIIPNAKVNPHAIQRTGSNMDLETNAWKLLNGYVNAISNDMYTTGLIEQTKSINQVISQNNPNMGNFLNTYIKEQLVGQTAKIDRIIGLKPDSLPGKAVSKFTRARNTAGLLGNMVWSLTVQPASYVNTVARTGAINATKGLVNYATNKSERQRVNKLPSMMIKSKGKSVGRTLGGDVDSLSAKLGKTKLDKFNNMLAIFPDAMEQILTGASASAAYADGKKIGLTGEALDMYADTIAQNTQSMYNKEARPVIMNNKSLRLVAPFQTFAFEQYRYAKTLANKGGGIPLEARDRFAQIIRLLAAMFLYSKFSEKVSRRQLNTVGTFIPFVGSLVDEQLSKVGQTIGIKPREYSGSGKSVIAPFEDAKRAWEAIDAIVQYNNFQPMRKELVKWGMGFSNIGGASTVNRFVDGLIASEQGYQETRSGKVAFPVTSTKDKITSKILGPYGTKAGKEYIEGGFHPLGDNQSEEFKNSNDPKAYFDNAMVVREYNSLMKEYKVLQTDGKDTTKVEAKMNKLLGGN